MILTRELVQELREELEAPTAHIFEAGVIGGACSRCGAQSGRRKKSCHPPSSVRVDAVILRALLTIADKQDVNVLGELIHERDEAKRSEDSLRTLLPPPIGTSK